ncbi:hypothetical protein EZV62_023319 [Acer yangbiense]|uniref:RNA-directed DNA polymerase n=1 Tax=Acer yangbiense TaxID=1000413 RepID=A0A5C7H1Y4_9ROSI|nr:hypothetical protein EZV62_023319 [Acer yangbiense]
MSNEKQDGSSGGDRNEKQDGSSGGDRITTLELQVQALTTAVSNLVNELSTPKVPRAYTSEVFKPKKKVDEEDEDDDSLDSDTETDEEEIKVNSMKNLKVDFKVDIPVYDGIINAEKLDRWIDRLEIYYTVNKYSKSQKIKFASLKLSSHALTWWKSYRKRHNVSDLTWKKFKILLRKQFYPIGYVEERWYKWQHLKQKMGQAVQEYITEFHNQALVLDIDVDDYDVFMKYIGGLAEFIRKELKLFTVETIEDATVKAIAIESKNKRIDKRDEKQSSSNKNDWKKTGEQSKNGSARKNYCDHCQISGHIKEKCWRLHPELQPQTKKNNEGRKSKTATLMTQHVEEIPEVNQADTKLALMANPKDSTDADYREELFHVNIQVKQSVVEAIIDPGSQKNLISETLVQQMGLDATPHPKPYPLGWIQKDVDMQITKQCTFKFAITDRYIDEVTCEVVPLDVCQVILGSPYLWDRDAIHYRRLRKYRLVKEGKEFHINACKPKATNRLMTATQAKRMVNASGGFVLLMIRPLEHNAETIALSALSLTPTKCCDIKKLQEEFKDLFQEVQELPPRRVVEHEIQLVGDSPLPNLGLYRTSLTESEEIKRQIQELLEQGAGKLQVDPEKVRVISQWPTPRIVTDVRSFIGACQYLRKFIRHFSQIAAPLHSLTKANQRFEWTKKHGETFQLLKRKISEAPVLALPNLQRPFEVEADASNYALGAVLFQDGKPVAYHSEIFDGPVLNYPTYDKELYALHQAVKHWRVYLLGKEVVVHSDHKPLQFLTTQSKLQQARHMKWMSYLQQFNIVIKYKKGVTNKLADMLSRPPTPVSSTLLVAMQIQPMVPSEYATRYDTDPDFVTNYQRLLQGKTSEYQMKDGLLYKGTQLCIPEDGDRLQWI